MPPHNYRTLRQDEFIKLLSQFGIFVREGKGSEIVLEGQHHIEKVFKRYRLAGKRPKRPLAKDFMKTILRRWGISLEGFFNKTTH